MTIPALLQLKNISLFYDQNKVLDQVSFSLYSGQITALVGDNGAGKSSLVKLISGSQSPDSGLIYWQGQLLAYKNLAGPASARKLGIQVVHQQLGLIPELSLWRNFFLGNEITRGFYPFKWLDKARMRQLTEQALNQFDSLKEFDSNHLASHLSGGEKQVLALCRAHFFNSKLLILDEPTSALSIRQTQQVLRSIRQIANLGIAVLWITHQIDQVSEFADKLIYINKGKILLDEVSKKVSNHRLHSLLINKGYQYEKVQTV